MKRLTTIILTSVALLGCHSRKVSTSIVSTSDQINTASVKAQSWSVLDSTIKQVQTLTVTDDTTTYTVEITPDSGMVTVTKGNFKGHANKITIKGTGSAKGFVDQLTKQNNHILTNSKEKDSTATQETKTQKTKDKQTSSTPSPYPWIAAIIAILIIVIAAYCYLKGMF